jgi:hypothetical protein
MASKQRAIAELRTHIREMLTLLAQGSTFPKLSRAQGQVDGYMRALLDSGQATERELLALVSEVRREMNGEATGEVSFEPAVRVA